MKFRRSLVKLTFIYLLLIMVVSGFLSYALYGLSPAPLERRMDLGERMFREDPFHGDPQFLYPPAIEEVRHRIALALIYFNLFVFCVAGLLSYTLAKRQLKPMETALDLQSRFTSDAAHELRTPLTAMKTEIEVALRGGELGPGETRELLESNLEEIGRLESLSASLLKLAQYEQGMDKSEVGDVPLREVIDESLERVRRTAQTRGIEVTTDIADLSVTGSRVSLAELFVILLDNSIKYSDDGMTITVLARSQGRHAIIEVNDQGYGISQEDLVHIFDRFYRGNIPGTKKRVEGYGLGLSIARRITEIHKGTIEIESTPGEGTTAKVSLPLARAGRRSA